MTGRMRPAIAAALALALAVPAASEAKVTIGSNLSLVPIQDSGLGTWANGALQENLRAEGGLRSPVKGVVTTWRIRIGPRTAPVALRVIRPLGHGLFTGTGTSSVQVPAANTISTFSTHLPIGRGDLIGNDTLSGSVTQAVGNVDPIESRLLLWFQPMLADGDPGSSPNVNAGGYVSLINADVEPTSRFKDLRVKPLSGGRLWIALKLPNEGIL